MYPFQLAAQYVAHLVGFGVPVRYAFLPLFQKVLIVSFIYVYVSPFHFHYRVAHAVEEIAVVGDHEKGAAGTAEKAFEVLYRIYVQVVGRLVHNEEVGLACQHLGECHPLDLASGEFLHFPGTVAQLEIREELLYPSLVFPEVLQVEVFGILPAPVHHLTEDFLFRVEVIFLFQEGDAHVPEEHYASAGIALVLAGEYLHK